jgi:hypothetical protein
LTGDVGGQTSVEKKRHPWEGTMATSERWIEVDAEINEADREWTEFMFRSLVGHYRTSTEDVEWSLADDVEKGGLVTFADLGAGRTRVTVSLHYTGGPGAEEAVGAHLERDLAEFKTFTETRG